jgi:amphi-Trp domain-containing protein
MMSSPRAYEYKASLSREQILEYLENVVAGIRSGKVTLKNGQGELVLETTPTTRLEVSVKQSDKSTGLKLKFKWRNDIESRDASSTAEN